MKFNQLKQILFEDSNKCPALSISVLNADIKMTHHTGDFYAT